MNIAGFLRGFLPGIGLLAFEVGSTSLACADRLVLAPQGETLAANSVKAEFALSPYRRDENYTWLQFSSPVGIELEFQRVELAADFKKRYALNIQYPLLTDLGQTPALSVGIRDALGTGLERQAVYLSASKNIGLSARQARLFRELKLEGGFGSGRMNGAFLGIQAQLRSGLQLSAEFFRQKPNISLGLPLTRNLQAKATSLDGRVFYGLSFTLTR